MRKTRIDNQNLEQQLSHEVASNMLLGLILLEIFNAYNNKWHKGKNNEKFHQRCELIGLCNERLLSVTEEFQPSLTRESIDTRPIAAFDHLHQKLLSLYKTINDIKTCTQPGEDEVLAVMADKQGQLAKILFDNPNFGKPDQTQGETKSNDEDNQSNHESYVQSLSEPLKKRYQINVAVKKKHHCFFQCGATNPRWRQLNSAHFDDLMGLIKSSLSKMVALKEPMPDHSDDWVLVEETAGMYASDTDAGTKQPATKSEQLEKGGASKELKPDSNDSWFWVEGTSGLRTSDTDTKSTSSSSSSDDNSVAGTKHPDLVRLLEKTKLKDGPVFYLTKSDTVYLERFIEHYNCFNSQATALDDAHSGLINACVQLLESYSNSLCPFTKNNIAKTNEALDKIWARKDNTTLVDNSSAWGESIMHRNFPLIDLLTILADTFCKDNAPPLQSDGSIASMIRVFVLVELTLQPYGNQSINKELSLKVLRGKCCDANESLEEYGECDLDTLIRSSEIAVKRPGYA